MNGDLVSLVGCGVKSPNINMDFIYILLSVWVWFYVIISSIIVAVSVVIMSYLPINARWTDALVRGWGAGIMMASGVRGKVVGMENIDEHKPYVYLANHQSMYDIWVVLGAFPPVIKWFAKKELFDIPLIGRAMANAGYLSVDRDNPRDAMKALKEAATTIRNGSSVMVFPEGARTLDGHLQPFKKGGFVLAIEAGIPIVPVIIRNSWNILPRRGYLVHPQHVILEVLPPIETKDLNRKQADELMNKVYAIFYDKLKRDSGESA